MSDPKQLRFQFVVDEASLQKTRSLIREITSDLTKLNNEAAKIGGSMGGMGGGGGVGITAGGRQSPEQQRVISKAAPAARPLVQNFLDQKNLFKGVAEGSRDSMRMMTDALKRAVADQRQEVQRLQQSLEALASTYNKLGGAGGGRAASIQSLGIDIQGKLGAARERLVQLENMGPRSELMPEVSWPDDPRWGREGSFGPIRRGRLERARDWAHGERGNIWDTEQSSAYNLKRIGKNGLALVGGAAIVGNEVSGMRQAQQVFQGQRNDIFSGAMSGMAGGDLSYGLALMRAARRSGVGLMDNALTGSAGGITTGTTILQGIGSSIGNGVKAAGSLVGLTDAPKGAGGLVFGDLTPQGVRNKNLSKAMGTVETERKAISPIEMMALGGFSGSMDSRVMSQRLLGLGGFGVDRKGDWQDPYGDLENKLRAQGLSGSELIAAKMQLQGIGGNRFAGKHAYEAMYANAMGYGQYGHVMAASARAGDWSSDPTSYRGWIGGGIDINAGLMMGSSVLGTGWDPRGATSGIGANMAIQGGGFGFTGGIKDMNLAQRAVAGLGLGDSIVGGGIDDYQKGRNLISAVRANPGMSIYGQDYLANGMNTKQMIDMAYGTSDLTATAKSLGLSRGSIKNQLTGSLDSFIDRFKDDPTKNDPMSKTIRAIRASGGDVGAYLEGFRGKNGKFSGAGMDAIRDLGSFYGIQSGEGEEAGLGVAGVRAGLSNAELGVLKTGGIGVPKIRGAEGDFVRASTDIQKQITEALKGLKESVSGSASLNAEGFKAMDGVTRDMGKSSTEFVTAVKKMTDALVDALPRIRAAGGFKTGAK